jgi:hypothetical protein
MSKFDELLKGVQNDRERLAHIRVMDTALVVAVWLKEYDVPFNASDVLGFTRLILAHEQELDPGRAFEVMRGNS